MALLTAEEMLKQMEDIIKEDPRMILAFRPKIIPDKLLEYAVAMRPELFPNYRHPTFRVAMAAVRADGFNLEHIDPVEFSGEQMKKLCFAAVEQNPKALSAVPKDFRSTELVGYVYSRDSELLLQENRLDEEVVTGMIDRNPSLIQYVKNPPDSLIIRALSKDPRIIVYFRTISEPVRDFFEEHYPQYASMILHD